MTDVLAEALSGRRLLLVLDNCEHVLDAVADLVDTIMARTSTVSVIATSREGLRIGAEQLWSVPSLDVGAGADSAAVELFVERARAVAAGFSLNDEADRAVVTEICIRLDGIALAIELAAARMVSMNPTEVRDRLDDRFRLLSGSRRGLERHQTLRHAVGWSYDLLDDEERDLLNHCWVFAGGFDLAAATHVCGEGLDEYAVLDLLDSLVRKSLVTTEQVLGHTRYGLLETIRQYAEDQLAAGGTVDEVRDRHAGYYAEQAVAFCDIWFGPDQRAALDWVEVEFANLRSGFRWATDNNDLVTATTIAAHVVSLGWLLQLFEPVGWAEEILEAATVADVPQLPRLYAAASSSMFTEGGETAVGYAQKAVALETDPRYDPFEHGWNRWLEAMTYIYAGQMERAVELATALAAEPGFGHVTGLAGLVMSLPAVGQAEQARLIADEALVAARDHGNPLWIAMALFGLGRAFADTDPTLALTKVRESLEFARETGQVMVENVIARDAAGLEALHGDIGQALKLFDTNIDSFHRAGSAPSVAATLASLTVFLDRIDRPEIAATVYGTTAGHGVIDWEPNLPGAVAHLRSVLGENEFDDCAASGAAMEFGDAVQYARQQIKALQVELGGVAS